MIVCTSGRGPTPNSASVCTSGRMQPPTEHNDAHARRPQCKRDGRGAGDEKAERRGDARPPDGIGMQPLKDRVGREQLGDVGRLVGVDRRLSPGEHRVEQARLVG